MVKTEILKTLENKTVYATILKYAALTDQVKIHYYHTGSTPTDTNICCFINSTWKWWTYCDLVPPFLFFSSCQKYRASSPQHQVPPDTDSCLNYKGSNVSNEPTEISSYGATLSYPEQPLWPQPQPLSLAKWAFHLLFRNENVACCRHRGALKNRTACKTLFFFLRSLSPTNQQFRSKLICIQCLRIPPMFTAWKYKFHSSLVWCSLNCLELGLAAYFFFPRSLWSITCYHLMADALILLMCNGQALKTKFSRDDWSCLKDYIPLTFGFDWNCHILR